MNLRSVQFNESTNERESVITSNNLKKGQTTSLQVSCHRSIHDIDENLWDSINSSKDLFHTHRFIRSLEDANVEDSEFWYLLFWQGKTLMGTSALTSFVISLDLFVSGFLLTFIRSLRSLFPRFLKIKILFCGLPISLGKNSLAMQDISLADDIFDLLVQEMESISNENGIRFMCVKEFLEEETKDTDRFLDFGFFRAQSIPYVRMNVLWEHFSSYLSSMRHGYRRQILRSLNKFGVVEPIIHETMPDSSETKRPQLVLISPGMFPPARFFELYMQVMERAINKMEVLNQSFFENLFRNMGEEAELLTVVKNGNILGAALITVHESVMTFVLVGLDYPLCADHDVYLNLLNGITALAIKRKCIRLDLGQTSYWSKQRVGGTCIPTYFYLRAINRNVHFVLKVFRSLLFPELRLDNPRVFREKPQPSRNLEETGC